MRSIQIDLDRGCRVIIAAPGTPAMAAAEVSMARWRAPVDPHRRPRRVCTGDQTGPAWQAPAMHLIARHGADGCQHAVGSPVRQFDGTTRLHAVTRSGRLKYSRTSVISSPWASETDRRVEAVRLHLRQRTIDEAAVRDDDHRSVISTSSRAALSSCEAAAVISAASYRDPPGWHAKKTLPADRWLRSYRPPPVLSCRPPAR